MYPDQPDPSTMLEGARRAGPGDGPGRRRRIRRSRVRQLRSAGRLRRQRPRNAEAAVGDDRASNGRVSAAEQEWGAFGEEERGRWPARL